MMGRPFPYYFHKIRRNPNSMGNFWQWRYHHGGSMETIGWHSHKIYNIWQASMVSMVKLPHSNGVFFPWELQLKWPPATHPASPKDQTRSEAERFHFAEEILREQAPVVQQAWLRLVTRNSLVARRSAIWPSYTWDSQEWYQFEHQLQPK